MTDDDLNEEQMSPEASPGKTTNKSGVRRVNNLPMYLIGAVLLGFLVVMVLVASDRAAKQNRPDEVSKPKGGNQNSSNSSVFANELIGASQQEGIIPAAAAQPPDIPDLDAPTGAVLVARPDNLDLPPAPPNSAAQGSSEQLQQTQKNDELERIRMAKMQLFEEAVKGKTGVQISSPRSSGSSGGAGYSGSRGEDAAKLEAVRQQIEAARYEDPTEAYKARLAMIQGMGMAGGRETPEAPSIVTATESGGENGYAQFTGSGQGDRWELNSEPKAPRTPFELRAGFVLPATLISGINSELPGQIIAQISQNVFDTATGKYLLIPQGSRLVGAYSSDVAYGQSRVLVAWQRIVFPDGKAMDIGAMPGADSAGYSGFKDKVNNHYIRTFGSALLMSAVVAGVSLSQDDVGNNDDQQRASDAMSEALGQQLGQAMAQMISKNLNIAPTIEIRPGYRFNVMVTKDMTFSKPYKSFDY